MADTERPHFEEGQILGAEDLNATVNYAAAQIGRHNRLLHTWGIAEGLAISKTQRSGYVEFSVGEGVAIDGWGYELINTSTLRPSTSDFVRANVEVEDADAWYPVYIHGRELSQRSSGQFASRCAAGSRLSVYERVELTFGSPGSQLGLAAQTSASVAQGPGTGAARITWLILVGYVQWNGTNFKDAITSPSEADAFEPSEAVEPRWVGVRAEQIEAPNGRLFLRTGPADEAQVTVLALDHDGDALIIGKQDGTGIQALMSVSPSGVVKANSFEGLEQSGATLQSGIARDGMVLPLPPGINAAALEDGSAELHTQLTPRFGFHDYEGPPLDGYPISVNTSGWDPTLTVPFVLECRLDEERRLNCRIRWVDLSDPSNHNVVLAGVADYLMVVTRRGEQ